MAFKLPRRVDCSGIVVHDYSRFVNKEEIGKGSFGSVYTADDPTRDGKLEKVVIKKLLSQDAEDKKHFVKEARIHQGLKHANIVAFKGRCNEPFALVLEYAFFDFTAFGGRTKGSSLKDFLAYLDCFDCVGFDSKHMFEKVCKEITLALEYLHGNMVAHRDLTPANVLVDNRHYCNQDPAFREAVWLDQSHLIEARFDDLKKVDVWGLGMTLLVLLNPAMKHPYSQELQEAPAGCSKVEYLEVLLAKEQLPRLPLKYQNKNATNWYKVQKICNACLKFTLKERPSCAGILEMLNQDVNVSSMELHLKVSQASALEEHDRNAAQVFKQCGQVPDMQLPGNDGTPVPF